MSEDINPLAPTEDAEQEEAAEAAQEAPAEPEAAEEGIQVDAPTEVAIEYSGPGMHQQVPVRFNQGS